MRARTISSLFAFVLSIPSSAQIWLGGPGLEVGQYFIHEAPAYKTYDLGYFYQYEVHGFYGRTDADQVAGTYVDSNGYMRSRAETTTSSTSSRRRSRGHCSNSGGSTVTGWAYALLVVDGYTYPKSMSLSTTNAYENTGDRTYSKRTYRFSDRDISLGFYFDGNTKDPDGYMVAFGAVIKDAPRPTGKLNIDNYILEGTRASVGYEINMIGSSDYYEEYDWDPTTWAENFYDFP